MQIQPIVVIRGGGDLATGVIQKFYRSGFAVLVLEIEMPTAIRRTVALSEAIYTDRMQVEDVVCMKIARLEEMSACHAQNIVPMLVDPTGASIEQLKPAVVIDAILAKQNLGTYKNMAPVTIGLGPGFTAPKDVHAVIETMRGHHLGRLILEGTALPNTGTPGEIGGKSIQRVLHAPTAGTIQHACKIGDILQAGETILTVSGVKVTAPFKGLLRGLIREGLHVPKGMKIADIDPRLDVDWHTISDKARGLGGAALEAYLYLRHLGTQSHAFSSELRAE